MYLKLGIVNHVDIDFHFLIGLMPTTFKGIIICFINIRSYCTLLKSKIKTDTKKKHDKLRLIQFRKQ